LILSILYCDSFTKIDAIKRILKFSLREAFCYRYKSAELVLKSADDLLQGPDYLKAINPEEKNMEVLRLGEKVVKSRICLSSMTNMWKALMKQRTGYIV
jgi:hypothetical protein